MGPTPALQGVALAHLSLRERSTRVSAAGEGLQVYPESTFPLTLAAPDLSPPRRGEGAQRLEVCISKSELCLRKYGSPKLDLRSF
ncbi:hypothetical protein MicloDRAFT_00053490 [Microvirga lotononidis]|uniref:Uncharacterized protein n=1 Tax=Microvirga lotononidis TaxID=864069 RepID=I4YKZ2_9HYPH|nr:hypothetical protein MicloDRAFT_00053490 [Microvirga lotononidis]